MIAFLALVIYGLGDSRWVLLLSAALAYLAFPFVRLLERRGLRREVATLAVLFFVVSPGTVLTLSLIPVFADDVVLFFRALPNDLAAALQKFDDTARAWGVRIPVDQENWRAFALEHLESLSVDVVKSVTGFAKDSFFSLTSAILWILNLILVPLFFFYVVVDFERWERQLGKLVPAAMKPAFSRFLELADRTFNSYLRGQLLTCLVLAALYGTGLQLVGLRFGWLIGVLTGVFSFIPYVGFGLGFVSGLIVALATHLPPVTIGLLIVVMVGVQLLESFYITPRLVGESVGLSPLEALIALIVCGNLFGFFGLLFALPIAALAKEVLRTVSEESP